MTNTSTNTSNNPDLAATVYHSGGSYPVVAGWGVMDRLATGWKTWALAVPSISSPTKT